MSTTHNGWTATELQSLAAAYPEHTATVHGRLVAVTTKEDFGALAARYPTCFRPEDLPPNDSEADPGLDAELARRYPSMFTGR